MHSVLAIQLASAALQGLYFLLLEHDNCAWLQKEFGCSKMVMVGDGATDLEARRDGGADIFIGCPSLSCLYFTCISAQCLCHYHYNKAIYTT